MSVPKLAPTHQLDDRHMMSSGFAFIEVGSSKAHGVGQHSDGGQTVFGVPSAWRPDSAECFVRQNVMRNGGQLLLESLVALGVERAFGVPSESYLAVLDALHDKHNCVDFVLCRDEGSATQRAENHGKLTGQPGVCFVTRAQGLRGAMPSIQAARHEAVPMIILMCQAGTALHAVRAAEQLDHLSDCRTTMKWAAQIVDVAQIPEVLARAWLTAKSGRPGPVFIELPEDMIFGQTDISPLIKSF